MIPPEHLIESASGAFSRKIWLLDPLGGRPDHLAIFLDGEYYVNRMGAPALIDDLQRRGAIPRLACAFVSHVDGAARHRDLTCSTDYAAFIARDLMRWMHQRYPMTGAAGHFIGGTSLGGLEAAFIALQYPQIFSRCLSHSGSFWWNEEWLTAQLPKMPASDTRFWSSVGDQETAAGVSHPPSGLRQEVTQIAACTRFAEALKARQHPVHHHLYKGGHELGPWRDELPEALRWLLNPESDNVQRVEQADTGTPHSTSA